jgi:multiple sugar transport system permease protein
MSDAPTHRRAETRRLLQGLAFLSPNIIGFMMFTFLPLLFSLFLAFSNWDLRIHNMFHEERLSWVALENFTRLLQDPDFWRYLRNTLFLMMGIPLGIAGSLLAAILLSKDLSGGTRTSRVRIAGIALITSFVLLGSLGILLVMGFRVTGMMLLIGSLACTVLIGGSIGGATIYRTLFFLPHFTAGVATFLLWKKLYSPQTGPINHGLRPLLENFGAVIVRLPDAVIQGGLWLGIAAMAAVFIRGLLFLRNGWRDGELGGNAIITGGILLILPLCCALFWLTLAPAAYALVTVAVLALIVLCGRDFTRPRAFTCPASEGTGVALLSGAFLMVLGFMFLGLSNVAYALPEMAQDGLTPPEWLTDYDWAKPAIMIMALWMAIGSNNMLLYLAGLSNVPPELQEAADIDGASGLQRFWHVTWPQLAPITFFIVIMSVIGGLQGGFEMARTMTKGGPAGSTTTLSYYVYTEGFETGRLGYASAVAWTLFLMVLVATLFNWKFGSRRTND